MNTPLPNVPLRCEIKVTAGGSASHPLHFPRKRFGSLAKFAAMQRALCQQERGRQLRRPRDNKGANGVGVSRPRVIVTVG